MVGAAIEIDAMERRQHDRDCLDHHDPRRRSHRRFDLLRDGAVVMAGAESGLMESEALTCHRPRKRAIQ